MNFDAALNKIGGNIFSLMKVEFQMHIAKAKTQA